jgi:2',3'-cyclic-nucleotide 2'-phosphodiesterase (5'-nucleotidase family)
MTPASVLIALIMIASLAIRLCTGDQAPQCRFHHLAQRLSGRLKYLQRQQQQSWNGRLPRLLIIVRSGPKCAGGSGDEMQGSLLSNINKGVPTIDVFNTMEYDVATFGNHEFDWGQAELGARTTQASYPYVSANIVVNDTGNCATAGWAKPAFVDEPYSIQVVGTAPNTVNVAFIGVTTFETPIITMASATAGLCFKDPADSILYYYDTIKAAGADVIVVLSHLGYTDGGYGYGVPVYGDQTLAQKLNTAGKPVNLIIGGHSHTNLSAATTVGNTKVVQAHYNGRKVGRADITVAPTGGDSELVKVEGRQCEATSIPWCHRWFLLLKTQ